MAAAPCVRRIRRDRMMCCATVAVALVLVVPAAAAAAPVLRSASAGPAARAGATVPVTLTIANPAKQAARRLRVAISVVPGSTHTAIRLPAVTIASVKGHATTRARAAVRVPGSRFTGAFTVTACLAHHCATTRTIQLLPGDAYDKLAAAMAAHRLSPGKAGLYEFYALRGDPRLPAAYRSTAPDGHDTPGTLATADWAHLSKADRNALAPYLLPPNDKQSAWLPASTKTKTNAAPKSVLHRPPASTTTAFPAGDVLVCRSRPTSPSGDWKFTALAGTVAVHAATAGGPLEAKARVIADAVPKVFGKLVTLDGFPAPPPDLLCDATQDPRLDVYLVPRSEIGGNSGETIGMCLKSSSFILIADDESDEQLRTTFAHEFFHAEQFAAGAVCGEPDGWVEGAATWAMAEVYPKNPETHKAFFWSLDPERFTLKDAGAPVASGYSAWPYWYFLRKEHGAGAIGKMFTLLGAQSAFDDAVRFGPGVDFDGLWKDFAVAMFNGTPVGQSGFPLQSFSAWDDYHDHPGTPLPKIEVALGASKSGPDPDTFRTAVTAKPLGLNYFDLDVIDSDVKEVTVTNGFETSAHVGVELWAETEAGWKRIDLTREGSKAFCFDTPDETFSHAVLAISNAGKTAASRNIDVTVNTNCQPHVSFDGSYLCSGACSGTGFERWDWSGSAKIDIVASPFPTNTTDYGLVSGTLTVTVTGVDANGCSFNGNQTIPLLAGLDAVTLTLFDQPPSYQFSVQTAGEQVTVHYSGCQDPPPDSQLPVGVFPIAQTSTPVTRDPAATTIEDNVDPPLSPEQGIAHYHWKISL